MTQEQWNNLVPGQRLRGPSGGVYTFIRRDNAAIVIIGHESMNAVKLYPEYLADWEVVGE